MQLILKNMRLGAFAGLVACIALTACSRQPRANSEHFGFPGPLSGMMVSEATIGDAQTALGWTIARPNTCLANDSLISAISVSADDTQVEIDYSHPTGCLPIDPAGALTLNEEQSSPVLSATSDPTLTQAIDDEATALGPSASVQTVDGSPGLVIAGNYAGDCDASPAAGQVGCVPSNSDNPTSATFQYSTLNVELIGDPSWSSSLIVSIGNTVS